MAVLRQSLQTAIHRSSRSPNDVARGDPSVGLVYTGGLHNDGAAPLSLHLAQPQGLFRSASSNHSQSFLEPLALPSSSPFAFGLSGLPPSFADPVLGSGAHGPNVNKDSEIARLQHELGVANGQAHHFESKVSTLQQQLAEEQRKRQALEARLQKAELPSRAVTSLQLRVRELEAELATMHGAGRSTSPLVPGAPGTLVIASLDLGSSVPGSPQTALSNATTRLCSSSPSRGVVSPPSCPDSLCPFESPGGQRRAVIVGCDYPQQTATLRAGVADAQQWARFFMKRCKLLECDIRLLTDDPVHYRQTDRPEQSVSCRDTVLRALQWLTIRSSPGDELFFVFCGLGTQVVDDCDGKGLCESAIAPTDVFSSSPKEQPQVISDTQIHRLLLALPACVRATLIYDCCHAGRPLDRAGSHHLRPYVDRGVVDYEKLRGHPVLPRFLNVHQSRSCPVSPQSIHPPERGFCESTLRCHAVQWAACSEEQLCIELPIEDRPSGVFTHIFICALLKLGVQASSKALLHEMASLTCHLKGRWRLQQDVCMTLGLATAAQQPFLLCTSPPQM